MIDRARDRAHSHAAVRLITRVHDVSDYVPGRYSGCKNFVYWMATKRHNWWAGAALLVYVVLASLAVVAAIARDGAGSGLPWAIGLGALALLALFVLVLLGFSLHWGFALVPDERSRSKSRK